MLDVMEEIAQAQTRDFDSIHSAFVRRVDWRARRQAVALGGGAASEAERRGGAERVERSGPWAMPEPRGKGTSFPKVVHPCQQPRV